VKPEVSTQGFKKGFRMIWWMTIAGLLKWKGVRNRWVGAQIDEWTITIVSNNVHGREPVLSLSIVSTSGDTLVLSNDPKMLCTTVVDGELIAGLFGDIQMYMDIGTLVLLDDGFVRSRISETRALFAKAMSAKNQ